MVRSSKPRRLCRLLSAELARRAAQVLEGPRRLAPDLPAVQADVADRGAGGQRRVERDHRHAVRGKAIDRVAHDRVLGGDHRERFVLGAEREHARCHALGREVVERLDVRTDLGGARVGGCVLKAARDGVAEVPVRRLDDDRQAMAFACRAHAVLQRAQAVEADRSRGFEHALHRRFADLRRATDHAVDGGHRDP